MIGRYWDKPIGAVALTESNALFLRRQQCGTGLAVNNDSSQALNLISCVAVMQGKFHDVIDPLADHFWGNSPQQSFSTSAA